MKRQILMLLVFSLLITTAGALSFYEVEYLNMSCYESVCERLNFTNSTTAKCMYTPVFNSSNPGFEKPYLDDMNNIDELMQLNEIDQNKVFNIIDSCRVEDFEKNAQKAEENKEKTVTAIIKIIAQLMGLILLVGIIIVATISMMYLVRKSKKKD